MPFRPLHVLDAHPLRVTIACLVMTAGPGCAAEFHFQHHWISRNLPIDSRGTGDYGLTALVDLDRDGDLDFVLGGRGVKPARLYWFEYRQATNWVQHLVGMDYQSDVGLAALDVDQDGWIDLVCSGVWYRNTGHPATEPFQRLVFATNAAGAHDILAADMDGDGRTDIVMMGDERTSLRALAWFKIPADPRQYWERHDIGPAVHGAITPAGVADIDGDGDLDVVRADTWFENSDGKGVVWVAHTNIPFGRIGPFGKCVRTAIVDLDGSGKKAVVMADADIADCRVVILRNEDGKGGRWSKTELPRSFTYGSLHSLVVADLNGDGRLDIVANEQEELLPPGRENPRWVVWENLGEGRFAERILLDQKLGGHELQAGDVDGDGDIDLCSKAWGVRSWNGNGGWMHVDFLENLLKNRGRGGSTSVVPR
jgi:hypothetical protein